jgi:hypothetical protein
MPKSYSAYIIEDLLNLGLIINEDPFLQEISIQHLQPSAFLIEALERGKRRKLKSEKAKSEHLVAPILTEIEELNKDKFATFSGYKFNVDKELGLIGFCDFILTKEPKSPIIQAPVFCVVEAKNDNLDTGIAQCIAEMYAAQLFNQKKQKNQLTIYGATTFGFEWKFLELTGNNVKIDNEIYYIGELPRLLGVLNYIVNQ